MIVEKAYLELYPAAKLGDYEFSLQYSGKFNHYNANVRRRGRNIRVNLSREWMKINDDLKIGLIQVLLNKIFHTKEQTQNMDLYEIFLKKVHIAVPKLSSHPILEESFNRINARYFNGLIEKPNLKWGSFSRCKLGSYEYGSDTITISRIFMKSDTCLLDYIMYHELLHKKHKFRTRNGRSFHHTKDFRRQESKFEKQEMIERNLRAFIRRNKGKYVFSDLNTLCCKFH